MTGLLFSAQVAAAAEPVSLRIGCPELVGEQMAEVEARARAALLTAGLDVAELDLECEASQARASLRAHGDASTSAVPLGAGSVPDQLIRALDAAIDQLSHPSDAEPEPSGPSSAAFESDRATLMPAAPPVVAPPRNAPRRHEPPLAQRRHFSLTSVLVGGVVEAWGRRLAPGALVHSRFGGERFGVTWAVSYQTAPSALFRADELGAALGADWRPPGVAGITLEGDVGLSLLSVTPHAPYRPRGATSVTAGFARLLLARPIVLRRFAILPAAGVRLFTAPRRLRLDGEEHLKLGYAMPELLLGLSYLFD